MTRKLQVYETPGITVSFEPDVCKHSGVCLRTLPAVFDVRRPRWVRPENEPADAVAAAVQKCPSGALQFYRNVERNPAAAKQLARRVLMNHVAVIANGPGSREERGAAVCAAIATARRYDFVGLYDGVEDVRVSVGWSGTMPPEPRAEMRVSVIEPATREVVGTIDVASNRPDALGDEDRDLVEDCGRAMLEFWTERE